MRNQKGITLIESLLVITIVSSMVFLLANLPNSLNLMSKTKHLNLAKEIASKQIEDTRMISYTNLINGENVVNDSRLSLLPQGTGIISISDCDPSICTNNEEIKHVNINISWVENGKTQNAKLDTFIGQGGIGQ